MAENEIKLNVAPEQVVKAGVGGGLEPTFRQHLEAKFNTDRSDIRVLQSHAPTLMRAKAYTDGNDIHFQPGFNASSAEGKAMIAHEVGHVVQQRGHRDADSDLGD